ncbi:hypothetical protein EC917_106162 [Bacillus thuringiensis]|uniref:Uncharacterized protein n=1 Tax=Bacillus thuringiensis TaxID=1428 RepID=A0A4R4BG28_BACTU|nr:hypothetical protein [Bacillus thuringiensis]TCW55307.1 hypothetical protein EC917_106162 [Bacillus thuringiensis]TCW55480.1 hypothetical protein EC910_10691 [Bacillus thuringiensis]
MEDILERLENICDESLRDGKGVIVHIDDFNWMVKRITELNENKKLTK